MEALRGFLLLSLLSGAQMEKVAHAPSALNQWLSALLEDDAAQLRPVRDWRTPVRVTVGFTVQSVLDMDEKQERLLLYVLYRQVDPPFIMQKAWQDERFSWDPTLHQGVRRVTVPAERIWVPDVVMYEMAKDEESSRPTQVSVSHLGWVEHLQPRLLESRCPLNLFHFPLDYHTCNLTFITQAHTSEEVQLHWDAQALRSGREFFSRGEWEVVSLTGSSSTQPLCHHHTSAVSVQVTVRRSPLLYLVTLLLPSSLLLVLDFLASFIPICLKQRLNMKASVFTGHFIFIIAIFTLFPPYTRELPLIEVYLFGSLGLLACSTMETAILFQVANGRSEWVGKYVFPCLSALWGRSCWLEPRSTDLSQDGPGEGDSDPEESVQWYLRALQQDLSQLRRDLQKQREEQHRLSICRELGSALDHAYLYLHTLVLLMGGVVLHVQWHCGP